MRWSSWADLRVRPSTTDAPTWSPSSVMAAPCHLLPCGAKALAVPSGALRCRWRSPHPSRLTPCHLPPGEGFWFLTPGAGVGADMIRPESCPKNGIPQSASLTASPIPFVPSGHFPLTRGIGLSQGGQGTGVTDCHVGAMPLPIPFVPSGHFPLTRGIGLAMTGFFDRLGSPCGGAGTASAVTERAASLVKGRWHGAAPARGTPHP